MAGRKTQRFEMRIEAAQLEDVDEWRRKQKRIPTMAEAIRRLIDIGLESQAPNNSTDVKHGGA